MCACLLQTEHRVVCIMMMNKLMRIAFRSCTAPKSATFLEIEHHSTETVQHVSKETCWYNL